MPYSTVYDARHQSQQLLSELGRGGEGTVYGLQQRNDVIVKIYHSQILEKRGPLLQEKIAAMQGVEKLFNDKNLSWPLINVFDQQQKWLGYAMYRASGKPMSRMAHAVLFQKHFPNLDRRQLVDYLLSMLKQIKILHKNAVMIGDYNLDNFICDSTSNKVFFIDCDSYQITVNGTVFPCPVGSPDMTPLEQHGKDFSQVKRTLESEYFSIAITLFKCLMLGRHPYDIVGGADPVTNLKKGNFPYGTGNRGIPKGHWYNIWSHMPHRVKSVFIRTFTEGARDPAQRASVDEWQQVLRIYRQEMDKGWHEVAIRPQQPKPKEYRGKSVSVTQA
ncbi:MAG: kinase [Gammaproteobacteria bacterium]|nr:kinase [Gammaproteobacteria bacterium]